MPRLTILLFMFCTLCFAAREPPKVTIPNQGEIIGREISKSRVQKIVGYHGIPYAQPPVRFAPPVTDPLPSWEGPRNGTDFMPVCLQSNEDYRDEAKPFLQLISDLNFTMQEDCLYLNVFVPYGSPPHDGFATIIWVHPGNFQTGTASMWNPHTLVYRHRVVLVTFTYRLNIFGFFSTMDGEAPGNYGLMDQQAAMIWVKRNIKVFGGNPDNISLMGYGSGGLSVALHMTNLNSRHLFHKAIVMSANFLTPNAITTPQEQDKLLDNIARMSSCFRTPTSSLVQCLRRPDGEKLLQVATNIDWKPIIDLGFSNSSPPFLSDLPKNYFERGEFHKIPFLTGYTDMEEVLAIKFLETQNLPQNISNENLQQMLNEIVNRDIPVVNNSDCAYNYEHINDAVTFFYGPTLNVKSKKEYRQIIVDFLTEKNYAAATFLQASYLSQADQPTFVYRFEVKPVTAAATENIPNWVSVPHLFDLIYVWGVPYWPVYDMNVWELRDKRISDIIMSFWTNFAKSSDPSEGILFPIKWTPFTKENPGILLIDGIFNMSNTKNLNYKSFEFWNEYYPKVLKIATECCSGSDAALFSPLSPYLLTIQFIVFLNA